MIGNFSLFHSHLDLAHQYWEKILRPGDFAIDATCGNGYDTLKLARILLPDGGVIGIDIQEKAISRTMALLEANLTKETLSHVPLYLQSHTRFPDLKHPIRLIVYNLGYLPKGDKRLTTLTSSTLESLRNAFELIMPGGAISITCYPGHEEGSREEKAILEEVSALSPTNWNVCHHQFLNRRASPSLIIIQKLNS